MFGTYRSHDSLPPTLVVTPAKRASASASRAYGGGRAPGPAMGRVKPEGDSGGWKRRCVHGRRCVDPAAQCRGPHHIMPHRSEEHTSELQSLMRISYAVFCLKKKK